MARAPITRRDHGECARQRWRCDRPRGGVEWGQGSLPVGCRPRRIQDLHQQSHAALPSKVDDGTALARALQGEEG